jgi:hypothetical protein
MDVSGQLHAPADFPQGKIPWYTLDRRLGEPQSRSELGGEEKNSQPLPGLEPPIIQPVAQRCTTALPINDVLARTQILSLEHTLYSTRSHLSVTFMFRKVNE